ncbi:MAG: GHKL domain-containing protein [Deltaproteobacteria bacterium]|nr:MAG: GHKL domain-containing protein [Deltaproteobacteria bacterium]
MKREHCARALARAWVHGVVHGLCLVLCFVAISDVRAEEEQVKRVLIVHSFGSSAPPFTTHSTAFETTLTQEMGKRVDLDQVSLDMARYAQPDMEEVFVEFLHKRLAKWQPDLVVPIGSPAGRFVVKFRDRLFPGTPVIYTGMDRRTVPPDAITRNATFVGEDFKLTGLVEDILQLAPDTTNIEVILGATPLERYWTDEFRRAFEPFADRVSFNFLNELSFDQMLRRLSKLPPHSFILLGLFLRDAAGVTHNEDEALQRLHAVANAPINGLYQNQLGLGIVGGRLYQGELEGVESARIAVRVLGGEPMSNFPPMLVGTQQPRYDWRELRRWNISESRLPPGSVIEFRQPTVWKRYQWWIIGALAIICLQAAMIVALVVQRRHRRQVEADLRESQQVMELATSAGELGLWSRDLTDGGVWANASLRSLFGFGADDAVHFEDLLRRVHPDDRRRMLLEVENTQPAAMPFDGEFRVLLPNGTERWLLAKGRSVVEPHDRGLRRMGTVLEITERKHADAELRRNREELAHVTRITTMGELAASLAHELNQPLTAILSNAQAAQRFLSGKPSDIEEGREILHDIVEDNKRAGEVIRRMRALVKKGEFDFSSIDLSDIIQGIMSLVHSDAVLRNLRVRLDVDPDLPPTRGDKIQLQQVLLNLLLNAFEAMKDCPADKRDVSVRAELDGRDMLQISVSDHGTGLTSDQLDKIFQPFFTTKREGLGMGLSISRSIVEAHGGRLWAENNADHGATFYFTLPVTGVAVEQKEDPTGPRGWLAASK